jgi:hypothetical protein
LADRQRVRLEQLTQRIDRQHPDWNARQVEAELETLASAVYRQWKGGTPNDDARLRQVQRWRRGLRNPVRPLAHLAFRHLWPTGERQRAVAEPGFLRRVHPGAGSHRVFLQNCSEETVHDLRATLGGQQVTNESVLRGGQFAEVHWTRNPSVRAAALAADTRTPLRFPLRVEFVVARGTRRAGLSGELFLEPEDGWMSFVCSDGAAKEIE